MPGLHVSLNDLANVSRHHSCLSFKNISGTRLLGSPSVLQAEHFMSLKLLKSPQPQRAGMNKNVMSLVAVALSQPHAAYATFIHGLSSQ